MLIHCDQCHSKYKITIKKIPSKPVNFRCGKCQKTILISPEDLKKDLEAASIPETAAPAPAPEKAEPQPPEPPPPPPAPPASASPPAEGSQTETVQLSCLKCGTAFVKPKEDKARLCYQCRIDAIVTKIRDKYGVTQEVKVVEAKNKYSFRTPDGLILGPIKLKTASVLVREKKLKGIEEVSKDGGEYRPLAEFEELKKLFPDLPEPQPAPAPKPPEVQEEDIPLDIEQPSLEAPAPPPAKTKPVEAPPPEPSPPKPPPAEAKPKQVSPPLLKPVEASKPAPPPPAPENVSRYKIRYPDGLVLGPIRLIAVEDLVAAGNLNGQEEVQKDNGSWKQFLDYPELKALVASGEEIAEDEVVELTDMLEEVS